MTDPRGGPAPGRTPSGGGSSGSGRSGGSGGEYAGLGLQFGFTIIAAAFLGRWLDERLGTSPWLLLLLVFVGAGGAFYSIYRKVMGTGKTTGGSTPPDGETKR